MTTTSPEWTTAPFDDDYVPFAREDLLISRIRSIVEGGRGVFIGDFSFFLFLSLGASFPESTKPSLFHGSHFP